MRIPCLRAVFHNLQRCCNVTLIHGLAHLMPFAQADPELFLGQAADRTASGTPVTGAPRELATALSFFEKFVQIRINIDINSFFEHFQPCKHSIGGQSRPLAGCPGSISLWAWTVTCPFVVPYRMLIYQGEMKTNHERKSLTWRGHGVTGVFFTEWTYILHPNMSPLDSIYLCNKPWMTSNNLTPKTILYVRTFDFTVRQIASSMNEIVTRVSIDSS